MTFLQKKTPNFRWPYLLSAQQESNEKYTIYLEIFTNVMCDDQGLENEIWTFQNVGILFVLYSNEIWM